MELTINDHPLRWLNNQPIISNKTSMNWKTCTYSILIITIMDTDLAAQGQLNTESFYEKINEKGIIQSTGTLNLQGKVKSIKENYSIKNQPAYYYRKDTVSTWKFNEWGLLTEFLVGDTSTPSYNY